MIVVRVPVNNADLLQLVAQLDKELAVRDGKDHSFYAQFSTIDQMSCTVVAYNHGIPLGCGALKRSNPLAFEIKRMFTIPSSRGVGVASLVLQSLEIWAKELGALKCILETGYKQPEAITLYERNGYTRTPNFGPYVGVSNSVCFEKVLG